MEFHSAGKGDPRDVVQKLRLVLESFCRGHYPAQFTDKDTLGVIVGKIRSSGPSHPLYSIVEDLDEINIYSRPYHHGENPNATSEFPDGTELASYVKRHAETCRQFNLIRR